MSWERILEEQLKSKPKEPESHKKCPECWRTKKWYNCAFRDSIPELIEHCPCKTCLVKMRCEEFCKERRDAIRTARKVQKYREYLINEMKVLEIYEKKKGRDK